MPIRAYMSLKARTSKERKTEYNYRKIQNPGGRYEEEHSGGSDAGGRGSGGGSGGGGVSGSRGCGGAELAYLFESETARAVVIAFVVVVSSNTNMARRRECGVDQSRGTPRG